MGERAYRRTRYISLARLPFDGAGMVGVHSWPSLNLDKPACRRGYNRSLLASRSQRKKRLVRMVEIENEHLFLSALREGVNLVLGAGFSVLAEDATGTALPVGPMLKNELIAHFDLSDVAELTLPQICSVIESESKDEFYNFLQHRFTVREKSTLYDAIPRINVKTLLTTNIDDLAFAIFEESNAKYINDVTTRSFSYRDNDAIDYVPLHGCVRHRNPSYAFSSTDIAAAFPSDPDIWHVLTQRVQEHPSLFWGYAVGDAGVLQALNPKTTGGRPHKDKWIVVRKEDSGQIKFYKSLGFQIIVSDTINLLQYLDEKISIPAAPLKGMPALSIFPEHAIPTSSSVVSRPVVNFYQGSAPTWWDIYHGNIHRTAHCNVVKNEILAGKNVFIVGLPLSGKTTTMMQAALDVPFTGPKFFFDLLTPEKAELVISKLSGERAMFFIDNVVESRDAVLRILADKRIQLIGTEQSYTFDTIAHSVAKHGVKVIDVTDISRKDVQSIYEKIPGSIRKDRIDFDGVGSDEHKSRPYMFEIIEKNVNIKSLRERFRGILSKMEKEVPEEHDFFLMCCYVHLCRTPVSYDMAYSFCNRTGKLGYGKVYEYIETLKQMIREYEDDIHVDQDQDYFTPRSSAVSSAVYVECGQLAFKRVFQRFHRSISPLRIPRYDVFKRYGFDHKFALKAFPEWQEGKAFWEMIYKREENPYNMQHGALYMSEKKQFKLAFSWIDEAISVSGGRISAIKNSHAGILFSANIGLAQDGNSTARVYLDQSMDILTECYKRDARKTYHALRFADQALTYWKVYGDSRAASYLETSRDWLAAQAADSDWNRNVERLSRKVLAALN